METASTARIMITREVERKLKNLQMRAQKLEKEFDKMITRATDLEESAERCADEIDVGKKTVSVIEIFMSRNGRARSLLSHVSLFFIVLLKKVQQVVPDVRTVSDLWIRIQDAAVSSAVNSVTEQLGFTKTEEDALRIIFDVVRDRNLSEHEGNNLIERALYRRQCDDFAPMTSQSGGDTEITGLILYLNRQKNMDSTIKSTLRRMVAVAYCSVVGNSAHVVRSPRFHRRGSQNVGVVVDVHGTVSETKATSRDHRIINNQELGTVSFEKMLRRIDQYTKAVYGQHVQHYDVNEDQDRAGDTDNDVSDDKSRTNKTDNDVSDDKSCTNKTDNDRSDDKTRTNKTDNDVSDDKCRTNKTDNGVSDDTPRTNKTDKDVKDDTPSTNKTDNDI